MGIFYFCCLVLRQQALFMPKTPGSIRFPSRRSEAEPSPLVVRLLSMLECTTARTSRPHPFLSLFLPIAGSARIPVKRIKAPRLFPTPQVGIERTFKTLLFLGWAWAAPIKSVCVTAAAWIIGSCRDRTPAAVSTPSTVWSCAPTSWISKDVITTNYQRSRLDRIVAAVVPV